MKQLIQIRGLGHSTVRFPASVNQTHTSGSVDLEVPIQQLIVDVNVIVFQDVIFAFHDIMGFICPSHSVEMGGQGTA